MFLQENKKGGNATAEDGDGTEPERRCGGGTEGFGVKGAMGTNVKKG